MSLEELNNQIAAKVSLTMGTELRPGMFRLEYTSDPKFGDFSTNIAMVLAKEAEQVPHELAEKIASAIEAVGEEIASVSVAGPGFINITLAHSFWRKQLMAIDEDYARSTLGASRKVQVEYISANPTGPLTIGNARGGFIGDVLSNLLERSGFKVVREYYFNDAGVQIDKLLESVKMEAGALPQTDERQYRGEYITELATSFKDDLEANDDESLRAKLTHAIIDHYIKPATKAMGIKFDVWFNEIDLIQSGLFKETIVELEEKGLVFERDGAVWLNTGALGDAREERVIVKSNGQPTYMAPDIAYHVNIFKTRKFDYAIKVLGPDHIAQFPSVYAAVHALFPDKTFRMASYQWLRIIKDGKEVKVSKRLGQFVTVQQLIDEVTMPVARFLTLMRSAESHMDFDLDLAAEQSAKNPYYYVMYSYARANSVLEKAAQRGLMPNAQHLELTTAELALIKCMSRLPELVTTMAEDYGVHRLTFYGLEVAKLFTELYEQSRLIDLPAEEAAPKLFVLQKFVTFMDVYWSLLGIPPQKRMSHED